MFLNVSAKGQLVRFSFHADKMGSPFNIIMYASDSATANKVATESFKLVDSLVHIFSDYDESSEISFINKYAATAPQPISPLMEQLLLIAKEAYYKSNHTYNIAIGPLSLLWRKARASKRFPTKQAVITAKNLCQFEALDIDSIRHLIYFKKKGMRIDFGGLGKGFIGQQVIDYLQRNNINHCMVDAGGKIETSTPKEATEKWKVGINKVESKNEMLPSILKLSNEAVASSGAVYQFFIHKGVKYGHIINPQTGYGLTVPKNVTVIAKNGVLADWLATACSILPEKEAYSLVKSYHGEIMIVTNQKNKIKYFKSEGFSGYY